MAWPVLPHGFLGTAAVTGDEDTYQIERSLRFNSADSTFLNRTPSSATSRTVWTFSCWVKRSSLNSNHTIFSAGTSAVTRIAFEADAVANGDSLRVFDWDGAAFNGHKITTALFRDPSAWYHIVVSWNTAEAAADRIKIYVNGSQITSFSTNINAGTGSTSVNNNVLHRIGQRSDATSGYINGYLTEVYLIDGQALTPSDFGETDSVTGRWKAKSYGGTYGTNGFYLNFADNSGTTSTTLGKDSAGSNNWTPNNFSVTAGVGNDSFVDSPANYGALTHTFSDDTYQISRSLRFNSPDNSHLSRTFSSPTTQNTFTLSLWAKLGVLGTTRQLFGVSTNHSFGFTTTDALNLTFGGTSALTTTQLFKDPSTWHHIVWTQSGTSHTLYVNGTSVGTATATSNTFNTAVAHQLGAANTTNYFNGCLTEVYFIDGQALTPDNFGVRDTNTYIWKPKSYTGTYGTNGFYLNFSDNSGTTSTTLGKDQAGSNNWTPSGTPGFSVASGTGNDSLVDTPTYYGTDAGAGGEARGDYCTLDPNFKVAAITLTNGNLDYSQTASAGIVLGTIQVSSGKWYWEMQQGSGRGLPGIAEVATPTSSAYVGATAKSYGYYSFNGNKYNNGANSAYGATFTSGDIIGIALNLDAGTLEFFKNNVSQGVAFTGISGTFTPAIGDGTVSAAIFNFGQRPFTYTAPSGFKALRDYNRQLVPTGGVIRGNYATMNDISPSKPTIVNGALQVTAGNLGGINTFGMTTGKWFCEMEVVTIGAESSLGISKGGTMTTSVGASSDSWGYYFNGLKYNNAASLTYGASYTTGDTVGCAFDADLGLLSFYKNGVYQGIAFSGLTSGPYFFAMSGRTSTAANNVYINFGQRPWVYGPPAGFRPVCTTSIPQPNIQKPSSAMDVVTYTGNGSARSITGLGFLPDLVWIKGRSGATDHAIYDSVRGVQLDLASNLTTDETTQTQGLTAFNSDGFNIGTLAKINTNASTYVAWAWDESAIDGLDIVSYTGNGANRTIAHNLGVAPRMIIIKARTTAGTDQGWPVWHASIPNTNYLMLDTTALSTSGATYWNSTSPTSSVFSLGTNAAVNANNDTYIAYLFAEVEGFSRFGSYTGNASADGTFVWCGFRPRWVMTKSSAGTGYAWIIHDTARNPNNVADLKLVPNNSQIENGSSVGGTTFNTMDILSNGFKLRSTNVDTNQSAEFIFAAFAESPFKYSRAR